MKTNEFLCGIDFSRALMEHLGLPPEKIDSDITLNTGANEVFGVTVKIMLNAGDMDAIAKRMRGFTPPVAAQAAGSTVSFIHADGIEHHHRLPD